MALTNSSNTNKRLENEKYLKRQIIVVVVDDLKMKNILHLDFNRQIIVIVDDLKMKNILYLDFKSQIVVVVGK